MRCQVRDATTCRGWYQLLGTGVYNCCRQLIYTSWEENCMNHGDSAKKVQKKKPITWPWYSLTLYLDTSLVQIQRAVERKGEGESCSPYSIAQAWNVQVEGTVLGVDPSWSGAWLLESVWVGRGKCGMGGVKGGKRRGTQNM